MRRFGLIGKTLKHSFSKGYFAKKFADEGITGCSYENFELPSIGELRQIIESQSGLEGLNITIPYKEAVLQLLDEQDAAVEAIGACNCIRIDGGKLFGFNTDAPAFSAVLKPLLQPGQECALVLGSGGASKAVQYALREMGIDHLVVSRRKAQNQLGYEDLSDEVMAGHQVIINTTPLGMFPNVDDDPPLPYNSLTPGHLLFDLTYNPSKTKFLKKGEEQGARIANGYEMLVLQAEESWRIWNSPK
jgi:shikimate dehydrogenase